MEHRTPDLGTVRAGFIGRSRRHLRWQCGERRGPCGIGADMPFKDPAHTGAIGESLQRGTAQAASDRRWVAGFRRSPRRRAGSSARAWTFGVGRRVAILLTSGAFWQSHRPVSSHRARHRPARAASARRRRSGSVQGETALGRGETRAGRPGGIARSPAVSASDRVDGAPRGAGPGPRGLARVGRARNADCSFGSRALSTEWQHVCTCFLMKRMARGTLTRDANTPIQPPAR